MPATCARIGQAMLMLAFASATVLAQTGPADVYRSAVDAYVRDGDISRAVQPLEDWKPQQFENAIRETIASKDRARMEATAIFQLEIGVALAGLSSSSSRMHIELGADVIDKGRPLVDLKGDYEALRLSWYAVAGSVYVATKDLNRARPMVEKVRDLGPTSPRVLTLMGSYYEADATMFNPDDSQTLIAA